MDAATERLLAEIAAHGYSGAVNILVEEGFSVADAARGVLGVIPRTVEAQIRAKLGR